MSMAKNSPLSPPLLTLRRNCKCSQANIERIDARERHSHDSGSHPNISREFAHIAPSKLHDPVVVVIQFCSKSNHLIPRESEFESLGPIDCRLAGGSLAVGPSVWRRPTGALKWGRSINQAYEFRISGFIGTGQPNCVSFLLLPILKLINLAKFSLQTRAQIYFSLATINHKSKQETRTREGEWERQRKKISPHSGCLMAWSLRSNVCKYIAHSETRN